VVQVGISPTTANVDIGTGTQTFLATVTNSSDTAVTWQVGGVAGGNATVGLITAAGVYSAPASIPTPATVNVTAMSVADPTQQASAAVTLVQTSGSAPGVPSTPSGLAASNVSASSVTLSWIGSTDAGGPGIGGYYVYRNGNQIATVSSGTSYTDTALSTATSYSYQVAAFDTANPARVSALSSTLSVSTLADNQPPTVPTGLVASNVSTSGLTLNWTASSDSPNPADPGVGGYYVYRNGTKIATVTNTSYTDAGLAASTNYTYTVAAFDNSVPANVSGPSAPLVVTTVANTQPPTAPGALAATAVSSTQVNLSWTASTDVVGVTNYLIQRCQGASCANFVQIATSTTTTYNNTGLSASTSYSYRVQATDAAGNLSPYSNTATVITNSAGAVGNVQSADQDPAYGNAVAVSFPASQTAGDLNVVVVGWSSSTSSVTSITDSNNNTYLVAAGPTTNAGNGTQTIYYAQNIAPGANTVTVTFNGTVDAPDVRVLEYSGIVASGALDVSAGASGNGTALNSGSATTTNAIDLLVGANYVGGAFAAVGNGYTQRLVSNPDGDLVEDQVVSTTGSYSATSTQAPSSWWVMQLAAFRTSGGSASATIAPSNAALTLQQTQQFTTNAPNGTTLTWSVDGITGGNATVGTVSTTGLYTPPATAGTHTVSVVNPSNPGFTVSASVAVTNLTGITTWHNDVARTGQNLQEYALTPASVGGGNFGKLWSCPLDGTAYAQPLYVANLSIGGGTHNVVFVATMNDSLYAFDADNPACVIYWQKSYISPSAGTGITTISSADATCNDVLVQYGITGTPVIDQAANTIFFVTSTTENGVYYQRLHAVNISTGNDQANSPVAITASVTGSGDGGSTDNFNALYQMQRPGLVLTQGGILIAFGSRCDNYLWPWHGWVMRYNETSLQQTAVFNTTPNGIEGGVWMSGATLALDSSGNMFFSSGNGTFDDTSSTLPALAPNNDFGESFLNLNPTTLAIQDFYTPSNNSAWSYSDLDIAAAGVMVLPDGVGPSNHPNVVVGGDKQGHFWMMDRNSMSGFSSTTDNTVQYLMLPGNYTYLDYATPAYYQGTVYQSVSTGPVMAFPLTNGLIPASGVALPQAAVPASQSAENYYYPNPTPSISASPSGNAVVWVLDNNATGTDNGAAPAGPAILRAYNASNLGTTLYSSATLPADTAGNAAKYTLPVVANGHVYVAGAGTLTVYGLSP
jgi:chitodextrinase